MRWKVTECSCPAWSLTGQCSTPCWATYSFNLGLSYLIHPHTQCPFDYPAWTEQPLSTPALLNSHSCVCRRGCASEGCWAVTLSYWRPTPAHWTRRWNRLPPVSTENSADFSYGSPGIYLFFTYFLSLAKIWGLSKVLCPYSLTVLSGLCNGWNAHFYVACLLMCLTSTMCYHVC